MAAHFLFAILCILLVGLLVYLACEIRGFRWAAALRHFRFSLKTLFVVITTIAVALGIDRLQPPADTPLSRPFAVTLLFCFVLLTLIVAVGREFGWWRRGTSEQSALEVYRKRHANLAAPLSEKNVNGPPAEAAPVRQQVRGKWWQRRMPNRFRTIGFRNYQKTPSSGYYDNR